MSQGPRHRSAQGNIAMPSLLQYNDGEAKREGGRERASERREGEREKGRAQLTNWFVKHPRVRTYPTHNPKLAHGAYLDAAS